MVRIEKLEMKIVIPAFIYVALAGCQTASTYEDVAIEITTLSDDFQRYEAEWTPLSTDQTQDFSTVVNICVANLESERKKFMGSNMPKKSIATIQLNNCIEDSGWKISIIEAITLQ